MLAELPNGKGYFGTGGLVLMTTTGACILKKALDYILFFGKEELIAEK